MFKKSNLINLGKSAQSIITIYNLCHKIINIVSFQYLLSEFPITDWYQINVNSYTLIIFPLKNAEKIRELKSLLKKAGFIYRSAKGSHTRWYHPLLSEDPITISGKDGDDAKIYIEKEVNEKLAKLKSIQEEELEE